MSESKPILGIDVGGSSIKAALVDTERGELVSDRYVVETPIDFAFSAILDRLAQICRAHPVASKMGIGFPAAVRAGVIESPPTAHEVEGWVGRNLAQALQEVSGHPVVVANDADCAGVAEVALLNDEERRGVIVCLTLGTGVGSAVFVDGKLVPNTELGKLFLTDKADVAEQSVSSRIRVEANLSWAAWAGRLNDYLAQIDRLFRRAASFLEVESVPTRNGSCRISKCAVRLPPPRAETMRASSVPHTP